MRYDTIFLDAGGVLVCPNWDRASETLGRHGVRVDAATLAAAEPAWTLATLPAPLGLTRLAFGVLVQGLPDQSVLAWSTADATRARDIVAYLARLKAAGTSHWPLTYHIQTALAAGQAPDWSVLLLGALTEHWLCD